MFGIGNNRNKDLFNNIIDMDLKEESSIILSVTSCVLALIDYKVSFACSNQFICQRENSKFNGLFQTLGVNT